MSYENELGNVVNVTDIVSSIMSPAFLNNAIGLALVHAEPFPDNTNVIKALKSGYTTAMAVSEGSNFTYGSTTELTDSSVTITGTKKVASSMITVDSLRFGGPPAQIERFLREQGAALGKLFDTELKALFASVTNTSTASSTLTATEILTGRYYVRSAMKGAHSGRLVCMLDYKGVKELDLVLSAITGTPYANQIPLGVLGTARVNPAHYRGNLYGIDIYETDGLPTHSSDDQGCMWDPEVAFFAGVDGASGFKTENRFTGSQGLWYELVSWAFWNVGIWNNTAACCIESDT